MVNKENAYLRYKTNDNDKKMIRKIVTKLYNLPQKR